VLDFEPERHSDWVQLLLYEVSHEAGRPRDQHEAPDACRRKADIDQRRATGTGTVDRQSPPCHLLVNLGHQAQQLKVRPENILFGGQLVDPLGSGIAHSVDGVAETRETLAGPASGLDR